MKSQYTDYLDSQGKQSNYINGTPYTQDYAKYSKMWSQLPLYKQAEKIKEFIQLYDQNQVVLVQSGTGSGKTVLIPKFVLKHNIENKDTKRIIVTNPKIITTINNAVFSAQCSDVKLGQEIGYQYKGSPAEHYDEKKTLLSYATDGVMISIIMNRDKQLENYSCIIIDEVHERNLNIDILLKLIKQILNVNKKLKLVIMSATVDESLFRKYFEKNNIKFGGLFVSGQPNFEITRTFATEKEYEMIKKDPIRAGAMKIAQIVRNTLEGGAAKKSKERPIDSTKGDILMFVATQQDTEQACKLLSEFVGQDAQLKKKDYGSILCISVYGKMGKQEKDIAINPTPAGKVKVVIATNVAESSLTIPGIVYVLDLGLELRKTFNAKDNSYTVKQDYTSQAQILQRIGRSGRTQPGIAFHFYTQKMFESFSKYPSPTISTYDLSLLAIQLFYSVSQKHMEYVVEFLRDLITPPTKDQVQNAIWKIRQIGGITQKDEPTAVGLLVSQLKFNNVVDNYVVFLSCVMNCRKQVVDMISYQTLLNDNIMSLVRQYDSSEAKKQARQGFLKFARRSTGERSSLHIALYDIMNKIYEMKDNKENGQVPSVIDRGMVERLRKARKKSQNDVRNFVMRNLEHIKKFMEQKEDNGQNTFQRIRKVLWHGYKVQQFEIKDKKFVSDMHTCNPEDCPGIELLDLQGKTMGNCSRVISNEGKLQFCMINLQ